MNKIFLLITMFFVCILLVSSVSATNWYVSTTSSGTASGDSWANKRNLRDFTPSFYSSRVMPGDTVYIDGGANGLTYTYAENNNSVYATFYWIKSGTVNNKITITRGVDPGHNGTPIIQGDYGIGKNAFFGSPSYTEISHLAFENKNNQSIQQGRYCIYVGAVTNLDIMYNSIKYTYGTAIRTSHAQNVRIMYNTIYTGVTDEQYTEDVFFFEGNSSRNNEIAYNYVLNENNFDNAPPFNETNPEGAHSDIFQFTGNYQQDGGTTRVHHNFFGNIQDTNGRGKQMMYFNQATGTFEIYNNIIVQYSRNDDFAASPEIMFKDIVDNNPTKLVVKIYNNNIISDSHHTGVFWSLGIDTVVFKNNLVYLATTIPVGYAPVFLFDLDSNSMPVTWDVDYNRYYKPEISHFVDFIDNQGNHGFISWDVWRSRYNVDTHSTIGSFNLVNIGGPSPSDYMFAPGSRGIDEGTPITGITDDFVGTSRPQDSGWDIGAYEYVSVQCAPADTDCNNCITLGEVSAYISKWLQGQIDLGQASSAVSKWLGGC